VLALHDPEVRALRERRLPNDLVARHISKIRLECVPSWFLIKSPVRIRPRWRQRLVVATVTDTSRRSCVSRSLCDHGLQCQLHGVLYRRFTHELIPNAHVHPSLTCDEWCFSFMVVAVAAAEEKGRQAEQDQRSAVERERGLRDEAVRAEAAVVRRPSRTRLPGRVTSSHRPKLVTVRNSMPRTVVRRAKAPYDAEPDDVSASGRLPRSGLLLFLLLGLSLGLVGLSASRTVSGG